MAHPSFSSRYCRYALLASILFLVTQTSQSQILNVGDDTSTPIQGSGHDYIKMFSETVSPANGSVSIRVEVPTPPGRGISLPFSFAYDSNGAHHLSTDGQSFTMWPDNTAYLSKGGWSYSIPTLSNVFVVENVSPQPDIHPQFCDFVKDYVFQDATGGRHSLYVAYVMSPGNVCFGHAFPVASGGDDHFRTTLGTETAPVTDIAGTVYTFPSQEQDHFVGTPSGAASSLPSSIEDRNGNKIIVTDQNNGAFTVADTLGRMLLSSSGFGSTGNTVTVSGLSTPYSITWGTASGSYSVNASLLFNPTGQCFSSFNNPGGANAIKIITLPNGQSYQFSYDSTYGVVNKLTYPTGGYVQYTWGLNSQSEAADFEDATGIANSCWYHYDAPVVTQRIVSFDGVHPALTQIFAYTTQWSSDVRYWTTKTTTVKTTDNITGTVSTTAYTYTPLNAPVQPNDSAVFASQIPLEQTISYENVAGTTLRTVNKTWNHDPYELTSEQTALNDSTQSKPPTSQTTYAYPCTGFGCQVIDKKEYDYGAGAPGNLLRETAINYQVFSSQPTPIGGYIVNQPCQKVVKDGSGNPFSETDYFYDNGGTGTVCGTAGTPSVTAVSSLTEHDETNFGASSTSPRGNATTVVTKCFQGATACAGGNSTKTYTYDEAGQVTSVTDPCGNGTCGDVSGTAHTTTYNRADNFTVLSGGANTPYTPAGTTDAYLTKIINPLGQAEAFSYDFNTGELTSSQDQNDINANRAGTTYLYNDPFARPKIATYPDGGQTTISYNDSAPSPSVTTTKLISSSPSVNLTATAISDGMGHVVQAQVTTDPDGTTYTAKTYDGFGRVYKAYNPTRCSPPTTNCGTETTWGITTSTYDVLGRIINVAEPDGSAVATSYSGNQTSPGSLTTTTDEVGNQRTDLADGLGRLTNVWEAPNVSGYNFQTTYVYDPLNDLTSVTQNGSNSSNARVRSFTYNSMAQLLTATNPESGTITYTYDLNGNVATRAEPKANQLGTAITNSAYTYDALNRLLTKLHNDPVDANSFYAYDGTTLTGCTGPTPPAITSPTNLIGRRSAMCSGNSASSFSYDKMGRTQFEKRNNKGSSAAVNTVGYTYYLDGSLNTLTYPSGDVVTYTVGGAERLTAVSDSVNSYVGYSGHPATYAPNGALAGMIQGNTSSFAGIATSNLYNDRLQPILLSAGISGGSSIFSLCYDFHLHQAINNTPCTFSSYTTGDNGNVFQVINNNDTTRSAAYIYDPLNRIVQAYTLNETSTNCWGETYAVTKTAPGVLPSPSNLGIDAWGNLTNRSAVSGMGSNCKTEGLTSSASTKNQLSVLTYDAAGDVTNDGNGNQATYDAENRIITDQGFSYFYDADGIRMEKSSGTSGTMYWPGPSGEYLTESDLTGAINEEYIYFNGERIARVDRPSGTVHYYFSNHLGSASVITSAIGGSPQQTDYYPYGGIAFTSGSDPNHYKFTGKERDSESGLDEFGARYYTSAFGRFMTPDWETKPTDVPYANFGNPQSLNLYSYVENNPTTVGDPDGHDGDDSCGCQAVQQSWNNFVDSATQLWDDRSKILQGVWNDIKSDATSVTHAVEEGAPGAMAGSDPIPGLGQMFSQASGQQGQSAQPTQGQSTPAQPPGNNGTSGGDRAGKPFTPKGKNEVKSANAAQNGGQTTCQNCGQSTVPGQQSQSGVTPPGNETHVDHIIPKSQNGDGSPSNGQVLCRTCNLQKSDKVPDQQ
jgi:RHS repeat-associated protein